MEGFYHVVEHLMAKSKEHSHLAIIALEIITIFFLIYGINTQVSHSNKIKFYEEKLNTYEELLTITGRLTRDSIDEKTYTELKDEFHELYNGKSQLFEGKGGEITDSILGFWKMLDGLSYKTYSIKPSKLRYCLEKKALGLATACREELNN